MPRTFGQKAKLLVLRKILLEQSDEDHPISTKDLIAKLDSLGIKCERKTLYDDIECLREFGDDIICIQGKPNGYFIASREFQLPELKLLVDAVQSSKFITKKKSDVLISKLTTLCNDQKATELKRVIVAANKIKTENESVYINVDKLHTAILNDLQISFKYFNWNRYHKKTYHRDGKRYTVSPFALIWDDENYYLIAYDHNTQDRRHFRVDKIENIIVLNQPREGRETVGELNPASFSKNVFGMFGGKTEIVTLKCINSAAGAIYDRFGPATTIRVLDDEHFAVDIKVAISPKFFAWVFAFDGAIEILSPSETIEQYKAMVNRASK